MKYTQGAFKMDINNWLEWKKKHFNRFQKIDEVDTVKALDEIENTVYAFLKLYGFRKYGRTLHRFASEDISQVIHFQSGMPLDGMAGFFCVNLGIRVPECAERSFEIQNAKKKYYHEYECTICSRLGIVIGKGEIWYDLLKDRNAITEDILRQIKETVLPAFEVLSSREAILAHRREYPLFDNMRSLIALEECMIFGHLGDMKQAKERFEAYYQSRVDEYNDAMINGRKQYLRKGETLVYMDQQITAEKDGYVTVYGATHTHIDYLDKLAERLQLR